MNTILLNVLTLADYTLHSVRFLSPKDCHYVCSCVCVCVLDGVAYGKSRQVYSWFSLGRHAGENVVAGPSKADKREFACGLQCATKP